MAKGDVVSGVFTAVADAAVVSIQPAAGVEWCILNIWYESSVELYYSDGTNDILFDSDTGGGIWMGRLPVTNSLYIKVKNISGAAQNIGYSGYQTK